MIINVNVLPAQLPVDEILNRAADLLETRGWCQQRSFGLDGRLDTQRALFLSDPTASEVVPSPASAYFRTYLVEERLLGLPEGLPGGLAWWNDDPRQTKETIVTELRRASRKYLADTLDRIEI